MSLSKIVSLVDDFPGCGTRPKWPPPGWPPKHHLETLASLGDEVSLNPQPIPPGEILYLWQAIRVYQLSRLMSEAKVSDVAETLSKVAADLDDLCPLPLWERIRQLIRHPPPPPPPWVDILSHAVSTILVAKNIGGDVGRQMQEGATTLINKELRQAAEPARAA